MSAIIENSTLESEEEQNIDKQFSSILTTLSTFKTQITVISTQLKGLEKYVKKEIKQHKKEVNKHKIKGNRKPSGFAEATPISNDLCDFMGKEHGSNIARTEVTKFICSYIKEKQLANDENKKIINPDDKLKLLLGTNKEDLVTYFNIQRYMNKHFIKNKNQNSQLKT